MALALNQNGAREQSINMKTDDSNMKGHNGRVRSVVWSSDDQKIISCGTDGAVYEWEVATGKRYKLSYLKFDNFELFFSFFNSDFKNKC